LSTNLLATIGAEHLPAFLTVEEYGDLFRRTRSSAYDDVHSGRVRALRMGRRLLIPRSEIERLLADALD
jgi:excisionase family DNA binding protein